MGSDQIANLPPVNFDGCIEDVESRQSACYPMTGVKISKLEVIEIVKQVTIFVTGHINEPSLERLDVNTSDGGVVKKYRANAIFNHKKIFCI
jgi:hypothetical protein